MINTATVSGGGDTDDTNNSATDAGGATAQADLTIAKAADQRVVPARGEVTFTLDVVNRGPSTATAAQVTDALAPNFAALEVTSDRGSCTTAVVCALGALAPGQRATITIRARVLDAAVASTVTNAATVTDTGTSDDPVPGNDSSEIDLDVPVSSDLQVDKTFAPAPNPTAGELVTYTIAVTNAGPSTAKNVTTRDVLPAEFYAPAPVPTGTFTGGGTCVWLPLVRNLRCAIDALAPGQTETITITARLAPDSRGKTVLNNVGAISDSVDPNPALATDTVSFVPIPAADLELTKLAPPDPVTPGEVARFTFQIANRGPSNAPDVIAPRHVARRPHVRLGHGGGVLGRRPGRHLRARRAERGCVARARRRRPGRPLAGRADRAQHRLDRLRPRRPCARPGGGRPFEQLRRRRSDRRATRARAATADRATTTAADSRRPRKSSRNAPHSGASRSGCESDADAPCGPQRSA